MRLLIAILARRHYCHQIRRARWRLTEAERLRRRQRPQGPVESGLGSSPSARGYVTLNSAREKIEMNLENQGTNRMFSAPVSFVSAHFCVDACDWSGMFSVGCELRLALATPQFQRSVPHGHRAFFVSALLDISEPTHANG